MKPQETGSSTGFEVGDDFENGSRETLDSKEDPAGVRLGTARHQEADHVDACGICCVSEVLEDREVGEVVDQVVEHHRARHLRRRLPCKRPASLERLKRSRVDDRERRNGNCGRYD